LKVRS